MLTTPGKALSIARNADKAPLTRNQKAFNTLIRKIGQGRARLAAWEATIPRYRQKHLSELQPLIDEAQALEIKTAHALDKAHDHDGLTRTERRKIAYVITEMVDDLLDDADDPTLKALYNKHSGSDYDEDQASDQATMKSAVEEIFGFDFGDDFDPNSPDGLSEEARAKIREQQAQQDAARQARMEKQAKRKKSPRQLEREAREQADAEQLKLSIREIYRKLASALHPDREPDPLERERKTALMQKVNQAYDKNNLLLLLELQLELEQIDQDHINNVSETRLTHYNKILREQLAELEHEILRVEAGFMSQYLLDPFDAPDPKNILKLLASQIAEIRLEIGDLQRDLVAFEDPKQLKLWLKKVRLPSVRRTIADIPF